MSGPDENGPTQSGTVNPPPYSAVSGGATSGKKTAEPQYEFKPQENQIIGELAAKMHFVGLFMLAVGVLVIVIGVYPLVHAGPIVTGTLASVVGLWTQRASVSLKSVVYTEGHDISHLIAALEDLRKLYSLQFWLLIMGLVLAAVTIVALSFDLIPASWVG
jgi:hypothetical protein